MEFLAPIRTQKNIFSGFSVDKAKELQNQAESKRQKTDEELKILSQQFESLFISFLFKSMRETVPKSGLFDSFAQEMYQSMFDQELGNQVSQQRGIGLADSLYRDLTRLAQAETPEGPKPSGIADEPEPASASNSQGD